MASFVKNWWIFLLIALAVIWYALPYATSILLRDPAYWLSAPGLSLRTNLRLVSAIVLVFGFAAQGILRAGGAIAIQRVFARSRSEPDRDVSNRGLLLPEQGASTLAALMALGFARLGEIEGPVGIRKGERTTHWLFAGSDGMVRASVTVWKWLAMPGVVLRSDFADGACVVTYFPLGRRIKRPGLWSDADKQSIERAYRLHQAHVQEFERAHSGPVQVTTVQQHLDLGSAFDKRHGRTMWLSLQLPNLLILAGLAAIAAAQLGGLFFLPKISDLRADLTSDLYSVSLALISGTVFLVLTIRDARRFLASL